MFMCTSQAQHASRRAPSAGAEGGLPSPVSPSHHLPASSSSSSSSFPSRQQAPQGGAGPLEALPRPQSAKASVRCRSGQQRVVAGGIVRERVEAEQPGWQVRPAPAAVVPGPVLGPADVLEGGGQGCLRGRVVVVLGTVQLPEAVPGRQGVPYDHQLGSQPLRREGLAGESASPPGNQNGRGGVVVSPGGGRVGRNAVRLVAQERILRGGRHQLQEGGGRVLILILVPSRLRLRLRLRLRRSRAAPHGRPAAEVGPARVQAQLAAAGPAGRKEQLVLGEDRDRGPGAEAEEGNEERRRQRRRRHGPVGR